jgi:peptide-methionine (S)-S-oxide reductase
MLRRRISFLLVSLGLLLPGVPSMAAQPIVAPPPVLDRPAPQPGTSETVVLAGGCFWGVQAVFQHVKGVSRAVSGYAGGTRESATYPLVSSGRTGHAEVVEVTFDPSVVSYGTILRIYFSVAHDPTEIDRQGPDVGPQYRSAIFAGDAEQRRVAEAYIAQLDKEGVFRKRIATKVSDLPAFYAAEPYHQDYATLHPNQPYIYIHDRPKVENLKRLFASQARSTPVLVNVSMPK